MPEWSYKLQLGDVFHNEDMALAEIRDVVVARIKRAPFYDENHDGELTEIVDELAEVEDVDEFDAVWDRFYDWADFNRVWVETFKGGVSS